MSAPATTAPELAVGQVWRGTRGSGQLVRKIVAMDYWAVFFTNERHPGPLLTSPSGFQEWIKNFSAVLEG